jgi:hypothetical protein
LFAHEPLLTGITSVAEPFAGKGNLILDMRARGLTVHASDILARGCPDCTVLNFLQMTALPPGCDVLVSNCPYAGAMDYIEHALALGFRLVVLLLKLSFLCTAERFERLHRPGHLRRVHVLAERLQDMHDANYTGAKAGQSQVHAWFVLDRDYCGPAAINPVSIHRPGERMPWALGPSRQRPPDPTNASRQARWRQRQRQEVVVLRLPTSQDRIDYLVNNRWLRREDIDDPVRVADALDRMLTDNETAVE